MKPEDLAQLGLSVDQIAEAQKVQAPEARTVQEGEMVEGSTVDMDRVKTEMDLRDLGALIRGGASALDVLAQWAKSKGGTVEAELMGPIEDSQGTGSATILCAFFRVFSSQPNPIVAAHRATQPGILAPPTESCAPFVGGVHLTMPGKKVCTQRMRKKERT